MPKGEPMVVYSVRLTREQREELRRAATAADLSEGWIVRLALDEHLGRRPRAS